MWYTEQSADGDHVKIREHLVDYVPVKADASFCIDDNKPKDDSQSVSKPTKFKIVSQPKKVPEKPAKIDEFAPGTSVKDSQTTVVDETRKITDYTKPIAPKTMLHGKEVVVREEKQLQKEISGDTEITRKIKDTKTIEKEHKSETEERKVFGVKSDTATIAPRFTKKIQPCRVNERQEARFECEFYGKPQPTVTWYRENFEIKSSEDFKVSLNLF